MRTALKALLTSLLMAAIFPALASATENSTDTATNVAATSTALAAKPGGVLLPAGSTLHVRLRTTLTSKTNKTGDKFSGYVEQPVSVNGQDVVPVGSLVDGHVVFVQNAKRVKGVGQMRIVLDDVTTENGDEFTLNGSLEDAQGSPCAKAGNDDEGTIKGCGKSKKDALKGAAIGGAMGAGAGATVGMGHEIDCEYYGNCGGPSFGADLGYGAAIGATAALVYNVFKHEKPLVLIEGTHLTFVVNRSVAATKMPEQDLNGPADQTAVPAGGLP